MEDWVKQRDFTFYCEINIETLKNLFKILQGTFPYVFVQFKNHY